MPLDSGPGESLSLLDIAEPIYSVHPTGEPDPGPSKPPDSEPGKRSRPLDIPVLLHPAQQVQLLDSDYQAPPHSDRGVNGLHPGMSAQSYSYHSRVQHYPDPLKLLDSAASKNRSLHEILRLLHPSRCVPAPDLNLPMPYQTAPSQHTSTLLDWKTPRSAHSARTADLHLPTRHRSAQTKVKQPSHYECS